jgi:NAD(P)H dehydrogenase (quinone)
MTKILIVVDSRGGKTLELAKHIARGAQLESDQVWLRRVARVSATNEAIESQLDIDGIPFVEKYELSECDALAIGSPTHFGNMSASLKYFIDNTSDIWLSGQLAGKPACAFTSTGSLHGGQESTLLSMMLPLMHHGMLICGLPYAGSQLMSTESGGTPYGCSHWDGPKSANPISDSEKNLAKLQGQRLAQFAKRLSKHHDA